jgi:hypothetical protein
MNSEFEKRLEQLPMRAVPPEWRNEILQHAKAAAAESATAKSVHESLFQSFQSRLIELLWPCPKAWGGLAAVWIMIAGLNLSVSDEPLQMADQGKTASVQWRMAMQEQQKVLNEFTFVVSRSPADRPRRTVPGPRSQLSPREIIV